MSYTWKFGLSESAANEPGSTPYVRPPCDCRGAAPAASRAQHRGRHERVDRHLPCGPKPCAARHVRFPDRQRGRRTRGGQPPSPRREPGAQRPARSGRPVSHLQALARLLPFVRGTRPPTRVSLAGRYLGGTIVSARPVASIMRGSCAARFASASPSCDSADGRTPTETRTSRWTICWTRARPRSSS